MSPRRNPQSRQDNARNDHGDYSALESELKAKRNPTRQGQRARERTAAHAEAESIARVTSQHYQSRPTA